MSGTNTLGENVTRVPNCASRTRGGRGHQLGRAGASSRSRSGESRHEHAATLLAPPSRGPVARATATRSARIRAPGRSSPARIRSIASRFSAPATVTTTSRRARDRRESERQARVRVQRRRRAATTNRSRFVERRGSREERRGVAVGAEAEVHEVDRRRRAHERVVRVRGVLDRAGPEHRVDRARAAPSSSSTRRAMPSFESRIVDRHEALVAEVHVDVDQSGRRARAAPRSTRRAVSPPESAIDAGVLLRDEARERERDVVDDLNRARRAPSSAILPASWTAAPSTCTSSERRRLDRAPPPAGPGLARRVRGAGPAGRARLDLGCGPGWHSGDLGAPGRRARRRASRCSTWSPSTRPARGRVVADLERLPFRRGALGGVWAHKSLHAHRGRAAADGARRPAPGARRSAARSTCRSPPTASRRTPTTASRAGTSRGGRRSASRDVVEGAGFDDRRASSTTARSGSTSRRPARACCPTPSGPACAC